jgi:hypothetical protein
LVNVVNGGAEKWRGDGSRWADFAECRCRRSLHGCIFILESGDECRDRGCRTWTEISETLGNTSPYASVLILKSVAECRYTSWANPWQESGRGVPLVILTLKKSDQLRDGVRGIRPHELPDLRITHPGRSGVTSFLQPVGKDKPCRFIFWVLLDGNQED